MDMTEYLENMGITICQRAFFSYMAKPQGSYGLHMIFRLFLKKKRIIMLERDRAGWCRFLADYAVLRLYIARFVLKDFARDYPPLLSIYAGFDRVEKDFPEFLKKEADYIIDTSRLLTYPSYRTIFPSSIPRKKSKPATSSLTIWRPRRKGSWTIPMKF